MPEDHPTTPGIKLAAKLCSREDLALITHHLSHPDLYKSAYLNRVQADAGFQSRYHTVKSLVSSHHHALRRHDLHADFKFIDLFAGIGGFRLSGNNIGGECLFTSEIDKAAQISYFHNYGEIPFGDITKITQNSENMAIIPDHDVLCGGFPCQAFSVSGKQEGFNDPRGNLFFNIKAIAKEKRPKVLFLENVRNLEKHDDGRTYARIKEELEVALRVETNGRHYYKVFSCVLDSSNFGAPTSRIRIYIIAVRKDIIKQRGAYYTSAFAHELLKLTRHRGACRTVRDILQTDIAPELLSRITINREHQLLDKFKAAEADEDLFSTPQDRPVQFARYGKGRQGERIYKIDGHAITFSAYGGGIAARTGAYDINGVIRKLTPRECARCMGFQKVNPGGLPIDMDTESLEDLGVSLMQQYKQFGNSVVVNVVQHLFQLIKESWLIPQTESTNQASA
jgi:DNA (cytosine-5)-methyltransferase 1